MGDCLWMSPVCALFTGQVIADVRENKNTGYLLQFLPSNLSLIRLWCLNDIGTFWRWRFESVRCPNDRQPYEHSDDYRRNRSNLRTVIAWTDKENFDLLAATFVTRKSLKSPMCPGGCPGALSMKVSNAWSSSRWTYGDHWKRWSLRWRSWCPGGCPRVRLMKGCKAVLDFKQMNTWRLIKTSKSMKKSLKS